MLLNKERIYKLVKKLPEDELPAAERFLRYLCEVGSDPVKSALLNAPEEDEVVSLEEEEMVKEAKIAYEKGDVLTEKELDKELDL